MNKKESDVSKNQLEEVKGIFNHLEKTFSQMKIFSSDHENVESFIDLLYDRTSKYLEKNWKLETGIEEFSFTLKGIPFYTEKKISKSLPFFFYKDGLKMLFFYKGLTRDELKSFLEIIKREASLPPEESDIVISLWEKDFPNIRYFAPDDYLETKIGIGMEIPEYKIDKNKLFSGKITLKPEDKATLEKKDDTLKKNMIQNMNNGKVFLSKAEEEMLSEMLQNHRKESEEKQFKNLLLDVLFLEKRPEKLSSLINQIIHYVNHQINKGNFSIALSIYREIDELRKHPFQIDVSKEKSVRKFFESPETEITVSQVEEILKGEPLRELDALLDYLSYRGAKSISVLSYLYDHLEKPDQKDKIISALEKAGKENPSELVKIARDEKPELTLKIISILRDSKDKRSLNHIASFLSFSNKRVLLGAIKAIGDFKDPPANKILFSLLSNPDQEIRINASKNIHITEEDPVLDKIIQLVKEKRFLKENRKLKQALFSALTESNSPKALQVLENFIKKVGILSSRTKIECALCAVNALEKAKDPAGYRIIKSMINSRNRKIRKKCRKIANELSLNKNKGSVL